MEGKKPCPHKCVFRDWEIEELQRVPALVRRLAGMQKILLAVVLALCAILLVPSGFIIVQSKDIGKLTSAAEEAIRSRERQYKRFDDLENDVKTELKKLYWAEKHSKDAKNAVDALSIQIRDFLSKKSPP